MKALTLADFPGMVNVCLFHEMRYRLYGDTTWRIGGSRNCLCERVEDARERLKAEIAWARADARKATDHAEALEAELSRLDPA